MIPSLLSPSMWVVAMAIAMAIVMVDVDVAIVSVTGNIAIASILPITVSAFTTTPQRQLFVARPTQDRRRTFSDRTTARIAEAAVPITEIKDGSAPQISGIDDSDKSPGNGEGFLTIVPPNEGFRDTTTNHEVSIASMNLLAPFYNSLQLSEKTTSEYQRWEFLNTDRTQRVPEAIKMAKRTNADVLCLQEIEGGKLGETGASEGKEFTLRDDVKEWLAESTTINNIADGSSAVVVEGYDSFVWSPLNPNNKRGDVVGLCIAWRSNKHSLVEWEGYRRGMVCRLQDNSSMEGESTSSSSSASFAVANLHLPARPSNVLGRLNTMSRTIRKLSDLDKAMRKENPKQHNTIHGLMVVAGDFNSDQDSVAARLLSHGYTNYGNVRDRNYKAKVTKASAADMSHPYRFIDSYDHCFATSGSKDQRFQERSFRDLYAPVTVSLKGRGPGIMDHLFYAHGSSSSSKQPHKMKPLAARRTQNQNPSLSPTTKDDLSASLLEDHLSKRSKRRKKGETRAGGGSLGTASAAHYPNNSRNAKIKVESVLATVYRETSGDPADDDDKRSRIIREGLPNLKEGFPSDHLPVGVLFSAIPGNDKAKKTIIDVGTEADADADAGADADSTSSSKVAREEITAMNEDSSSTILSNKEEISGQDTSPSDRSSSHNGKITTSVAAAAAAADDDDGAAEDQTQNNRDRKGSSGITSSVKRRRKSSRTSLGLRRRHNVVLNTVSEWLVGRGATSLVLDKPLYKNDLLARTLGAEILKKSLTKKSRAPDLMCVFVDAESGKEYLVVVEVAVASDPDKVRTQKASKYKDLVDLLSNSNKPCRFASIVVRDDGGMHEGTISDIESLVRLTSGGKESRKEMEAETGGLCDLLESKVSNFRIGGKN